VRPAYALVVPKQHAHVSLLGRGSPHRPLQQPLIDERVGRGDDVVPRPPFAESPDIGARVAREEQGLELDAAVPVRLEGHEGQQADLGQARELQQVVGLQPVGVAVRIAQDPLVDLDLLAAFQHDDPLAFGPGARGGRVLGDDTVDGAIRRLRQRRNRCRSGQPDNATGDEVTR
jgi:hypothetical protein